MGSPQANRKREIYGTGIWLRSVLEKKSDAIYSNKDKEDTITAFFRDEKRAEARSKTPTCFVSDGLILTVPDNDLYTPDIRHSCFPANCQERKKRDPNPPQDH